MPQNITYGTPANAMMTANNDRYQLHPSQRAQQFDWGQYGAGTGAQANQFEDQYQAYRGGFDPNAAGRANPMGRQGWAQGGMMPAAPAITPTATVTPNVGDGAGVNPGMPPTQPWTGGQPGGAGGLPPQQAGGMPGAPGQQGGGYPPQTSTTGPGATNPQSPWAPVQQTPSPPGAGSSFGGQSITNPQASPFDYQQVQEFSDAAMQDAMRYLGPQLEQGRRGLSQSMINQGADPASDRGQFMSEDLGRRESDAMNSAMFQALGFGRDTQNQMFQQDYARSGLARDMALGNLNADTARYGMDQNFNLGTGQLDLSRQMQDWGEMMGLEDLRFRDASYNESNSRYDQGLMMQMLGLGFPGSGMSGGINPTQIGNPWQGWDQWMGNAANVAGGWGG